MRYASRLGRCMSSGAATCGGEADVAVSLSGSLRDSRQRRWRRALERRLSDFSSVCRSAPQARGPRAEMAAAAPASAFRRSEMPNRCRLRARSGHGVVLGAHGTCQTMRLRCDHGGRTFLTEPEKEFHKYNCINYEVPTKNFIASLQHNIMPFQVKKKIGSRRFGPTLALLGNEERRNR